MANSSSPCTTVAKGSVGESGASAMVHHQVDGKIAKNMVLRNDHSDLCPNTGVVAVLVINGEPAAYGNITKPGSSIQAEAQPDDHVVAIVHTVPLFNNIVCVRLGNLHFILDECDFV